MKSERCGCPEINRKILAFILKNAIIELTMAFTEKLKQKVRKRAHFQCCRCKQIGVEVHHIVPEKDGGKDTEENAAPLCPNCHEMFGDNPTKRKSITEMRDHWYEICKKRYPNPELMGQLSEQMQHLATKEDLQNAVDSFYGIMQYIIKQQQPPEETKQMLSDISASFALSTRADEYFKSQCLSCGRVLVSRPDEVIYCPYCANTTDFMDLD